MDQIEMNQEQEQQQNTEQAENALEDFVDPASVVSLPINMKVGYMYSFLFQHLHRSFKGIFGVCISIAALVAFFMSFDGTEDTTRKVILLLIGLLFTVINPIMLLIKAKQQVMLSPIFKQPLQYAFSPAGMKVSQGEEEQFVTWEQILEVRKTPSVLILYTSRSSGSILAFKEMGEQRQEVERIIAKGCKGAGVKKLPAYMERMELD